MSTAPLPPSEAFVRAARRERTALVRDYHRYAAERDRLQARADAATLSLNATQQRLDALALLLGDPEFAVVPTTPRADPDARSTSGNALTGPAIRHTAVRLLLERSSCAPIHYRAWYHLLLDAGYVVSGKTPEAVFLTQVTRSPLVAKASGAGVYQLDLQAGPRLQSRLQDLQAQLHALTTGVPGPVADISTGAERRRLVTEINRVERDLREVTMRLGTPGLAAAPAA